MEQQAKERLTGGVILVVLLVLLVPELLTGPHAVPAPGPAQPGQAPMRSYTMDLRESPHANRAPVAASTATPAALEPTTSPSSAPAPSPSSPQTPSAPQAPPPVAPPRARAPTPTPAPAHSVEHATALWSVQLGTFSSRENAARLVAGLKSHGFTGSISEASRNGHKLFRVRVGAERDRVAAQKLLGRLKAAGTKGGEIVPH